MLFTVDSGSSEPLFEQLASSIRAAIVGGSLSAHERLPSARDLADSLDINLHTVLRAYQVLRDEGFVDLRRGRGAVVAAPSHDYGAIGRHIHDLVAEARRLGLSDSALAALIRKEYES